MHVDEQNELQEDGHAMSFLGSMCEAFTAHPGKAGAHASRAQRSASRGLPVCHAAGSSVNESVKRQSGDGFWRDAKISTRDACAPLVLLLLVLSFGTVFAQVGADVVDLEAGLVAKWDDAMPLDQKSPLKLPANSSDKELADFALVFALNVDAMQAPDHGPHVFELDNTSGTLVC